MSTNVEIMPNFSIKSYNDEYFKLIWKLYPVKREDFTPGRDINDEKLWVNISRAKSKVYELAICNDWDYFVTLTLDKTKQDRYDLNKYSKDLTKWIQNQRRKGIDINYLLIPEQHKDGAWHMHGLITGLRDKDIRQFTLEEDIPKKMKKMIKNGRQLYDIPAYRKKFGFVSIERVKSKESVAKYITKYISKALQADLKREKEKNLYYRSKGLKTSYTLLEGALPTAMLEEATFQGKKFDYVKLKDMNSQDLYNFMQSYSSYLILT